MPGILNKLKSRWRDSRYAAMMVGNHQGTVFGEIRPTVQLSFNDLGNGVVDLTSIYATVTPTFGRASTAWTRLASGLWTSVASGSPRSMYMADGSYVGYFGERGNTNRCLWNRDLTNAAWVKSASMTAAKNVTGIDGGASSASRLTAGDVNQTCLQSITSASARRMFSAWVKRSIGTGTIEITMDNGASWTNITSSINSSTWSLVYIPSATLTNPIVGFRISTSGDEILVDMCQEETVSVSVLERPSTPKPTTTVAVANADDVLTYPTSPWFNAAEGTIVCDTARLEFGPGASTISPSVYTIGDGTTNERIVCGLGQNFKTVMTVTDGGVQQVGLEPGPALAVNEKSRDALGYKLNDCVMVPKDAAVGTDVVATMPAVTTLGFGISTFISGGLPVRNFRYYNRRHLNAQLQAWVRG